MEDNLSFNHTIHVTFMYDGDSITFEDVDIELSAMGLIILEAKKNSIENTVIPYAGIKYYTIIEKQEPKGSLEVL